MAWIIASVPFWLIGGIAAWVALVGARHCIETDQTSKDVWETVLGFVGLMVFAGIFFAIAAKVAS